MGFMYGGRQVRRSTGTVDRRLAEKILGKIHVEIVEGRYFDLQQGEPKTFDELMDRYLIEHASK